MDTTIRKHFTPNCGPGYRGMTTLVQHHAGAACATGREATPAPRVPVMLCDTCYPRKVVQVGAYTLTLRTMPGVFRVIHRGDHWDFATMDEARTFANDLYRKLRAA